jgi:transcriptional regulator with XRE-family HTH domain
MSLHEVQVDVAHLETLADSLIDSHDSLMRSLIALRKRHRLTQDDVAERMGVSQPTVAAFERYDSNPTLSTIRRYALAVDASIDHHVDDACSSPDVAFDAVISASGAATWSKMEPVMWTWPSGPIAVKA